MRFLISFGMCKKSTKNEKSSRHFGSKVNFRRISGRVGGRGGRPGKGFGKVLLVLGQTLAEHSTRLALSLIHI